MALRRADATHRQLRLENSRDGDPDGIELLQANG